MATSGTPHEGKDNIIMPRVYTGLQLILYTNTPNSLGNATVLADLVQPTGEEGYAPKTLSGVWAADDGIVTYDDGTPDDPIFQNTGTGTWTATPTGAALTDGTYILHFKDIPNAPVTMTGGKKILIDLSSLVA